MPRWLILLTAVLVARTVRDYQRWARRGTTEQRGYTGTINA